MDPPLTNNHPPPKPLQLTNPSLSIAIIPPPPPNLTKTVEFDLMLPYGSGSYNTLEAIESDFGGAGVAFPYKLLFVDRSPAMNDRFVVCGCVSVCV
jgi:hypothetical protein